MTRAKYVKPQAQALDRTLAVSIGGCNTGITPGTCGLPGYSAGTCDPSGSSAGVPVGAPCTQGNFATGGCNPGFNAFAAGCGGTGTHANAPIRR